MSETLYLQTTEVPAERILEIEKELKQC